MMCSGTASLPMSCRSAAACRLRYLERPDHIVVVGSRGDATAPAASRHRWPRPRAPHVAALPDPADLADAKRMAASGFKPGPRPPVRLRLRRHCAWRAVTDPTELGRPLP